MELAHLRFTLVASVLGWVCFGAVSTADVMGLRLADGRYPNEGRVEVLPPREDAWGTYCSNPDPLHAGRVACRQLGFPALLSATASGQFGKATGPVWLRRVDCGQDVSEVASLDDCLTQGWVPSYEACDHRFDVGLACFTGNLRLVGGRQESEGRAELHVGGEEWLLLSSPGGGLSFIYADSICQYLGYPLSVGLTEEPAVNNDQEVLCSFSRCPLSDGSRGFFQCLDELSLKFCPDKNTTLLGAVCAAETDVLPPDPSFEYRLGQTSNGSQGILEATYNGSGWATVCLHIVNDYLTVFLANRVCRSLGHPWSFDSGIIPYSESPGYVSTGDELIMREVFLGPPYDGVRWLRGQNACHRHDYGLFHIQCETGVTMYGLTVFPCPKHTCRRRCGEPATDDQCGCDAVCSQCSDCCYDYKERCSPEEDLGNHTALSVGSFVCTLVDYERAVVVDGCSPGWNDTQVAQRCANSSDPGPVKYQEGLFFKNLHCAECNGLATEDGQNDSLLDEVEIEEYDLGIRACSPADVDPLVDLGCRSYSAVLTSGQSRYKNPHCAHCNGANISALDYCPLVVSAVLPAHFEVLFGRVPEPWAPEASTSLQLVDEIACFTKHFQLHVLPANRENYTTTEGTRCYLNTLGWQNIQLTWPFYSVFIDQQLRVPGGEVTELLSEYVTNVTDFEEVLDLTVLPAHQEGSSREWVVRCGVERVEFVEVCGTAQHPTVNDSQCGHRVFTAQAEYTRVFSMGGAGDQVVYVGGGVLVEAESVSFFRSYNYRMAGVNGSAKDTWVSVCGRVFESEECRLPHAAETRTVSRDVEPVLEYRGRLFVPDQVTHLPDGWILVCSAVFSDDNEPYISLADPLTAVNFIGYCLSIAALLVTFANYCVFPALRNVPGGAIMSLTGALFLAQLLTLTVLDKAGNQTFCVSMAVLMHFLWLATFTWMNVLAFDLMRTFTSRQVARPTKRVFCTYCLYGWGLPLLAVTACLVVHFVDGQRVGFRYGGADSCWVIGKYAVLGAFVVPMIGSLCANAVLFGWTVRSVHASLAAAAMVRRDKSKSREIRGELWIYFKISCVMGFTWLFGCLGNFVDQQAIWYIFVILNSLQGVLIFASFGCNVRIRNLWRDKMGMKVSRKKRTARSSSALSSSAPGRSSVDGRAKTVTSEVSLGLEDAQV